MTTLRASYQGGWAAHSLVGDTGPPAANPGNPARWLTRAKRQDRRLSAKLSIVSWRVPTVIVLLFLAPTVAACGGGYLSQSSTTSVTGSSTTSTQPSVPTWTIRSVPVGVGILNEVTCPSTTQCFAVGGVPFGSGPGWIIGSSDGGRDWQLLSTAPDSWFATLACVNSLVCTVVGGSQTPSGQGNEPVALITSDGGQRWSSESVPSQLGAIDGIACVSKSTCIATGLGIARTTDGGAEWVVGNIPSGMANVNSIICSTTSHCLIAGAGPGSGATSPSMDAISNDSGATWAPAVTAGGPSGLTEVSCSNVQHCVGLIGSDATDTYGTGFPIVTSDGGSTWARGSATVGQSVSCVNNTCVSVGGLYQSSTMTFPGDAYISTDGGLDWNSMSISTPQALNAVNCISPADCVAVGGTVDVPSGAYGVILTYDS